MFKKIFSLLIIILILFSYLGTSYAMTINIKNKDSGNSQIAGTGHVELYDKTYDIKKGGTLTLNTIDFSNLPNSDDDYLEPFLKFDTKTGYPAKINIQVGDFRLLERLFGPLTFNIEIREFNGRSRYENKIDYVKITGENDIELFRAGSPSNLNNRLLHFRVDKIGSLGYYSTQGFHVYLYSKSSNGMYNYDEHDINGRDFFFKDFPEFYPPL